MVAMLSFSVQASPEQTDLLGQLVQQKQQKAADTQEDSLDGLIKQKTEQMRANNLSTANKPAEAKDAQNDLDEDVIFEQKANHNAQNDIDELLSSAMGFLGVAYRFGGTTPSGFDCSGFMQYIFRKTLAINLPRTSAEQATVGIHIDRANLQAGDLVFFRTAGKRISHVGMYIGNNRFIHAPRTGKNIEITSLSNKYWNSRYATARRVKRNLSATQSSQ